MTHKFRSQFTIIFLTFTILSIWQLIGNQSSLSLTLLPTPLAIFNALCTHYPLLIHHALITLKEMVTSIVIALTLAFPLAYFMYSKSLIRDILQPTFILFQSIPLFVLAPILVIWLGWSQTAIIIPTTVMITIPLTLSLYQGFRSVSPALIDYFRFLQASKTQTLMHLYIPHSRLYLFSGLRICATISGIGAIGGEWAGAQEGLGMLMLESRRSLDLPMTFACLSILIIMSSSLYSTVVLAEYFFKPTSLIRYAKKLKLGALAFLLGLGVIYFSSTSYKTYPKLTPCRIILDWLPNPNHVPIYYALEQGYFKEQGLDATILKLRDPGDIAPYLVSGQADLGIGYTIKTLREVAKGAPLRIISPLITKPLNCFLFLKDTPIQSIKDLSNKTIGVCSNGFGKKMLTSILVQNNIEDVKLKVISFDLVPALTSGIVDVIYGAYWNIEQVQCESIGTKLSFLELSDFNIPDHPELIICSSSSTPHNTTLESKVIKIFERSFNQVHQNPKQAFDIYKKANPQKSNSTVEWESLSWNLTEPLIPTSSKIQDQEIFHIYQWLLDHGHLDGPVEVDQLIVN